MDVPALNKYVKFCISELESMLTVGNSKGTSTKPGPVLILIRQTFLNRAKELEPITITTPKTTLTNRWSWLFFFRGKNRRTVVARRRPTARGGTGGTPGRTSLLGYLQ